MSSSLAHSTHTVGCAPRPRATNSCPCAPLSRAVLHVCLLACTLCLDRVNSSMFEPCKWYVTLIAGTAACKLTVNSRIVTLHTTIAADKQKHTREHVHAPRLLMYGLDEQYASNMAAVQRSEASESKVAEDVYRQMNDVNDKAATQV